MPLTPMLLLTRRFSFSAAHRLHSPALDAAGNACAYGLCENIHGHNYRMEVTVSGDSLLIMRENDILAVL